MTVETHFYARESITRAHLEEMLARSRPHPVSVDRYILVRYKERLQELTEDAFEYFGSLLTNDDPEGFHFLEEAKRRGCSTGFVRSSRLRILFGFLRDETCTGTRVVEAWNELARLCLMEDDFNLEPFLPLLLRLKAQCG